MATLENLILEIESMSDEKTFNRLSMAARNGVAVNIHSMKTHIQAAEESGKRALDILKTGEVYDE